MRTVARRCTQTFALIVASLLTTSTLAIAGPPIDGPAPPSQNAPPPPPPLLTTTTGERPRTWEEAHVWEERATFVGLVGGALIGGLGSMALVGLAAQNNGVMEPAAVATMMGVVGVYGAGLGAYAGGFVGAGVGVVIDAASAPPP